eukprot:bmy_04702T0
MTRTNEHKSVVPSRAVQASGRGTETPQQGWLLAVPLFPGSRSEINQIRVKEKKQSNERKKEKARDAPPPPPRKGKPSATRDFGTGGLSEQTVLAAHSGQSHSKTQRPGRIALWQGFRWTIKCRDIPPAPKR